MQRVVINLIKNAVEALAGGGTVVLGAQLEQLGAAQLAQSQRDDAAQPGEFVVLRVEDTGIGIDSATIARIFEPFFTTKFTGRGLGLAVALGVVRSHHGAMRVTSTPGRGSRFDLAFPTSARSLRPSPPECRSSDPGAAAVRSW